MDRLVVLLTGPPGAGKTTTAHTSGLEVFDRDDWASETEFRRAIGRLAHDPHARAVVIRTAATSAARARWRAHTQATHCYQLTTDRTEAARRIRERARPSWRRELAALTQWWAHADWDDGVQAFPGWEHLGPATTPPPRRERTPRPASRHRGYGYRHRQLRAGWQRRIDAGEVVTCWRCGQPIEGEWDLGHDDDDRTIYRGPEHVSCNRKAGGKKANTIRWSKAPDLHERTSRRW